MKDAKLEQKNRIRSLSSIHNFWLYLVNWKNTVDLYRKTIGKRKNAKLTVKVLSDCNHNMQKCDTGGLFEDLSKYKWKTCDDYFPTMITWLSENGFAAKSEKE